MNVLITSAGRRVSLVKNFQHTLKKFDKTSKVFTVDVNPYLSSACQISDGYFKVPKVNDENYLNVLKKYCIENNIKIVIPTIDPELSVLAGAKEDFLKDGIFIAVSSKELCDLFFFKSSTEKFFKENGFNTPNIIKDIEHCDYPVFAKLNNSSSSIGAQVVYNKEMAKWLLSLNKNYIFQEYIKGDEFTVDTFIDKKGKVISIVPRQRLEVRAGEVSKAKTCKDKKIIEEAKKLCSKLKGAYGCITIQLFKTENKIIFIEVNPRFGGGYPLTFLSEANFAEYLIKDYFDIELEYNENWKDNNLMLRYDAEVIVDGSCI